MNPTKIVLFLVIVAILYYSWTNHWFMESMAPLNTGTFPNNYPRGKCNSGSFNRSSCEVGTCPLKSTVSNKEYCAIQCAQDPDEGIRNKCYDQCMDMMNGGCR